MSMRTLFRPIDESFICQYLHNWSVKHAPLCLSSDSGMRFTFRLCLSFSCSLSVFRLNNVPEQFCGCIIITFKTWMMIWSVIAVKGSFIEWMSITRNRKMWLSCGHRIFNIFNRVIFRRNHFTVLDRLIGLNKQERKRRMHTQHKTLTSRSQAKQIGWLFRCVRARLKRMKHRQHDEWEFDTQQVK